MHRAILTIATGKPVYWHMARELARSFMFWNKSSDIGFFILTDLDESVAPEVNGVNVLRVEKGRLGVGFSAKLHLDEFAPADQTLFIDADCLCIRPLGPVFDRFAGRAVSVIGGTISHGEWFGDVVRTCREASVPELPKFNGGIYYLERGEKSSAVYQRARSLLPKYDDMGLVRLRGLPNDELIMAIAMAQEDCWGIPEDGTVMGEFLSAPKLIALDAIRGKCELENPPEPDPMHRAWFPVRFVRPAVVHFLGHHVSGWLYRSEVVRLRLAVDFGLPPAIASAVGAVYRLPFRLLDGFKDVLRPAFHKAFGPRRIRTSAR